MSTTSTVARRYVLNGYGKTHEPEVATLARALVDVDNNIVIQVNRDGTFSFPQTSNVAITGPYVITGGLTVSTTSAVTGAATFGSSLALTSTGNFSINTNKFTVAGASGNTVIAGTLSVTGVQTFTGNTTCSGTLSVTGASTFTGTLGAQAITAATTLAVTGASTLTGNVAAGGTLTVTGTSTLTGNVTASGTLAVTSTATLSSTLAVASTSTFGGKISPLTDDVAALGDTTHGFSDLFLATGAVLNYANGDAVLTHSSGILTLGTGDLRITTAGTNTASVVTVGGTQTLAAKTLTTPVIGVATGTSLALTAGLKEGVTTISGDGAVTLASGTVVLTKGSAAAITVAAPSSQDGTKIRIISNSDFAHVVTFTGSTLLDGTTGANLTVTMTAFKGSAIEVVAVGTKWLLVSSSNVTSITT